MDDRYPEGTTAADIDAYYGVEAPRKAKKATYAPRREWIEEIDGPAADRYADAYFDRFFEPPC
jgi:hypothetical protein